MGNNISSFQNLTNLPIPYELTQCVWFENEILICGGSKNDKCYSYHTIKNAYRYICSYPLKDLPLSSSSSSSSSSLSSSSSSSSSLLSSSSSVPLPSTWSYSLCGHAVIPYQYDAKMKELTLLSFGGIDKHMKKYTWIMKYRSVWNDDYPSTTNTNITNTNTNIDINTNTNTNTNTTTNNSPINQWILASTNIGRREDDMTWVRALRGGGAGREGNKGRRSYSNNNNNNNNNNNHLFVLYPPNNIDVYEWKSLKCIKKDRLPIEHPIFGGSCLVNIYENTLVMFNCDHGVSMNFNEETREFTYETLPICSELKNRWNYSYVGVQDFVILFGGCARSIYLDTIYIYSMKYKTWTKSLCTLPIPLHGSFALLSRDQSSVHIIGGWNGAQTTNHFVVKLGDILGIELIQSNASELRKKQEITENENENEENKKTHMYIEEEPIWRVGHVLERSRSLTVYSVPNDEVNPIQSIKNYICRITLKDQIYKKTLKELTLTALNDRIYSCMDKSSRQQYEQKQKEIYISDINHRVIKSNEDIVEAFGELTEAHFIVAFHVHLMEWFIEQSESKQKELSHYSEMYKLEQAIEQEMKVQHCVFDHSLMPKLWKMLQSMHRTTMTVPILEIQSDHVEKKILKNALVIMIGISKYDTCKGWRDLDNVKKKDIPNFREIFENKLNYTFVCHKNSVMKRIDVKDYIQSTILQHKLRSNEYNYDSLIVLICGHGNDGDLLVTSDGENIAIQDIRDEFNCDAMQTLPKIFVMDLCRGRSNPIYCPLAQIVRIPPKTFVETRSPHDTKEEKEELQTEVLNLHKEDGIVMIWSTVKGYKVADRSLLSQAMKEVIAQSYHSDMSLDQMIIKVRQFIKKQGCGEWYCIEKQDRSLYEITFAAKIA